MTNVVTNYFIAVILDDAVGSRVDAVLWIKNALVCARSQFWSCHGEDARILCFESLGAEGNNNMPKNGNATTNRVSVL